MRNFSVASTMLAINSIVANALLFSSLLLVIGVPVFYMTQTNPEDNRNPNIKKIEILAGVWFHLVLLQALVGEYITHQMSVWEIIEWELCVWKVYKSNVLNLLERRYCK